MRTRISIAVGLAIASGHALANATRFDEFTPLTSSSGPIVDESQAIVLSAPHFSYRELANRTDQLNAGEFNSGDWDMITINTTGPNAGSHLFTVFETGQAGIQRTDLATEETRTIWQSPAVAPAINAHVAFDASYWSPWGTFITAEESWGTQPQPYGRLFEVTNPLKESGTVDIVHRNVIPRTSHEGIQWDEAMNMYFIDELNGGVLYKYTSIAGAGQNYFSAGQTSVLRVGDGFTPNATGAFTWVPITDVNGDPLAESVVITDPNFVTSVDGRASANVPSLKGTDYQRPEDLQIATSASGDELLFMATTTTSEIYAVNLSAGVISVFANQSTIDLGTGLPVGTALRSPDNLAIDADGNIYIIEDRNGGVDDDIWFANDLNHDGDLLDLGEGIARWATNGAVGSEFTGLYFDPFNPNRAWVNIQHPDSGVDRLFEITTAPVPVPAALPLLVSALGGLGVVARRRA